MATIHPSAIVSPDATLGEGVEIGPFCIVEGPVTLGNGVKMLSAAQVLSLTNIADDCVIHPGAILGGSPQDLSFAGEPTKLEIGPRCIIRENVVIHRGTARGRGTTTVGSDAFLMNNVHIGHDCVIGNKVIMATSATVGGHAKIGDQVILGGLAAVHQFCRIGRHAFVGGVAAVVADVIPYGSVVGVHAHLAGLNVIGLKRRGFTRAQIHEMRAAYRMLFSDEGTLQERLDDVAERFSTIPEVMEMLEFIRAESSRPLCTPRD